jgi:hypothetical protein
MQSNEKGTMHVSKKLFFDLRTPVNYLALFADTPN